MDVGVLVVDDVADFGLAAIGEVFATANALRRELTSPPPAWRLTPLGVGDRVRTGAGNTVATTVFDPRRCRPDLLVVPATNVKEVDGLIATVTGARQAPVLGLIVAARARGVPTAAACTGTFFLAEAGVLDGRTATTSWWLGPVFRRRYPRVRLDDDSVVCRSGEITTAGAAIAHVDLALALVGSTSPTLAELVARYLLLGNRRSQADFALPSVLARADPVVARFEEWVRSRLPEPMPVATAAAAVGMSERSLQRATAAVLGMSPLDFITSIRIEHAVELLRSTSLSAENVATRVGYANASTLRDVMRRHRGLTLRELREGGVPRSGTSSR